MDTLLEKVDELRERLDDLVVEPKNRQVDYLLNAIEKIIDRVNDMDITDE